MPLSDNISHLSSDEHKNRSNILSVKVVVKTYLIKQDISEMKFTS